MLNELVARIVADRMAANDFRAGSVDEAASTAFAESGIALALASETSGGFDLEPASVLPLLRALGGFPALTPLAERLYANWLLSLAGLPLAEATTAPIAMAITATRHGSRWRLQGTLPGVLWFAPDTSVLVMMEDEGGSWLAALPGTAATIADSSTSLAGEPRHRLVLDASLDADRVARLPNGFGTVQLRATGAAIRCQLIAGAAERVLQQTVQYAGERRQFGQPLAKFQAIQQQLAVMAGEASAASVAADAAAAAFGATPDLVAIAAAKIRCGEAAGLIAPMAHQIHGAIGYTGEHVLHRFTKQLWTWRDDYGGESVWSAWLGDWTIRSGAEGLWPALVPLTTETAHG